MGHLALELAGHWVETGLSVETEISGRALQQELLILCGAGMPLWVQCSGLGSPTLEGEAQHPAGAPRPCQSHDSEEKEENKRKPKKPQEQTGRTPNQMVK